MKLNRVVVPLAATLLLAVPQASFADHRGYGGHYEGGGPWWWIVPPLVYMSTLPYRYPDPQPIIIQQPAPATVIMQAPLNSQTAMPPQAQSWYYCEAANGYYPYVPTCPGGWRLVPATPPARAP